jgi:hypothetical protein
MSISAFSPFPDGDVESKFSKGCSRFAAAYAAQPTGMLQPVYWMSLQAIRCKNEQPVKLSTAISLIQS